MKAVRISFKGFDYSKGVGVVAPQEVRVTDAAEVVVLQAGEWTTLCFRHGRDGLYPYVQFHAELESWEEIYMGEKQ